MKNKAKIVQQLFSTEAFRVSEPEHPFWYTSGKFGPYYINTHFLYENEKAANILLETIDYTQKYPLALPRVIGGQCMRKYHISSVYQQVIDELVQLCSMYDFDYISGGARRDFFFSYAVAEVMGKEHLTILKDGSVFESSVEFTHAKEVKTSALSGKKAIHVADLLTEGSSYYRAWLPALEHCGVDITHTAVVIDRKQGAKESLAQQGIEVMSLVDIEPAFFAQGVELGHLSAEQEKQLILFYNDPDHFMVDFIAQHPHFLQDEERKDAKTAERVARFRALSIV